MWLERKDPGPHESFRDGGLLCSMIYINFLSQICSLFSVLVSREGDAGRGRPPAKARGGDNSLILPLGHEGREEGRGPRDGLRDPGLVVLSLLLRSLTLFR